MAKVNNGTHKPNYELKAKVIANGLAKTRRDLSLSSWQNYISYCDGVEPPSYVKYTDEEIQAINEYYENTCPNEWQEAKRVNDSHYKRVQRLKTRISYMLSKGGCIFLTLTFTNAVLDNTSEETRKQYVRKFLKANSCEYVANIDYGEQYEREHYHAVVRAGKIDNKLWRYGNIDFERCRTSQKDCEKMSKYVAKLTNHAIKETTKANYMIYSR